MKQSRFRKIADLLLEPPPGAAPRSDWVKEEARGERLANLCRAVYLLVWVAVSAAISGSYPQTVNIANIGIGSIYLACALGYMLLLRNVRHRPYYQYVSTTMDILLTTLILFIFHFEMRYATSLKSPLYLNYLMVVILAALRMNVKLPIYAGALSLVSYGSLTAILYSITYVGFGTPVEGFTTPRVGVFFLLSRGGYIVFLALLGYLFVKQVRRLAETHVKDRHQKLYDRVLREQTLAYFERYFSPELARYYTFNPRKIGPCVQFATLLSVEFRSFSGIGETEPERVVALLNATLEELVKIVFANNGVVESCSGNRAIFAFGVPETTDDDALDAVRAAWEVSRYFKKRHSKSGLGMAVAVHTGEALVGTIGPPQRRNLSVAGKVVEELDRLSEEAARIGVDVCISRETYPQVRKNIRAKSFGESMYSLLGLRA